MGNVSRRTLMRPIGWSLCSDFWTDICHHGSTRQIARRDSIDVDPVGSIIAGHLSRQVDHRAFGSAVSGLRGATYESVNGSNLDDGTS